MSHLSVHNIHKSFGDSPVIAGVSFDLQPGEACVVIGPSGGGKTTLLKCINLLCRIDHGRIEFDGKTIVNADATSSTYTVEMDPSALRTRIGMVFQEWNLWPNKTIRENIALGPICVKGMRKSDAYELAEELGRQVAIAEKMDSFPHSLSGGQKQRAAIARALAMRPELLMLDEVTSALDPVLAAEVLEVMEGLKQQGLTLLVVTHHIDFARAMADQVLFLEGGEVRETGDPGILDEPETEQLAWFLKRVWRAR